MKTRLFLMTSLFALFIIAGGQVAQAQQVALVDIPFDFVAGGTKLPAGEYTVGRAGMSNSFVVLRQSDDPGTSAMILTNAAERTQAKSQPTLVFHRYGDRYFLSQVWNGGEIRGRELMKSAAEKEVAKLAKLETKGEVTIAARLIPAQR